MFPFSPLRLTAVVGAAALVSTLVTLLSPVAASLAGPVAFHLGLQLLALALGTAVLLSALLLSGSSRAAASRLAALLLVLCGIVALAGLPALAQAAAVDQATGNAIGTTTGATVVELPYGQYIGQAQSLLTTLFTLVLTAVVAYLPLPLRWVVSAWGADRLARDAARLAVASTLGADPTAKLDVDVGSKVLARGVNYFIQQASPKMIKTLGGMDGIQNKIVSYLNIHPETTAGELKAAASTMIEASPKVK